MAVKLDETNNKRRLHIGSYFVDLNEKDYQELINIFGDKRRKDSLLEEGKCPWTDFCLGIFHKNAKSKNLRGD